MLIPDLLKRLRSPILIEALALLFLFLVAHAMFASFSNDPFYYDEREYVLAGRSIITGGLISKFSATDGRTYGYPLLLAGGIAANKLLRHFHIEASPRLLFFYAHLFIYIGLAIFARQWMRHRIGSTNASTWVFVALCLNVFNIAYLPHALTETVSFSLLVVSLLLINDTIAAGRNPLSPVRFALAGLVSGYAVMVRPANIFLFPLVIPLVSWQLLRATLRVKLSSLLFALMLVLACLPQAAINRKFYHVTSILPAADLAGYQTSSGRQFIKYATSIDQRFEPKVFYFNPFRLHRKASLLRNGINFLVTSALHVFNLFDQDLILPYNRTLTPWYHWWTTMISLAMVGLGSLGLSRMLLPAFKRKLGRGLPDLGKIALDRYVLTAAIVLILYAGLYSQTAVECRFGLPMISLLSIFIPAGINRYRDFLKINAGAAVTVMAAYLVCCAALSGWVRAQAPLIQGQARAPAAAQVTTRAQGSGEEIQVADRLAGTSNPPTAISARLPITRSPPAGGNALDARE